MRVTKNTPVEIILKLAQQDLENCSRCGHCCKYGSGFVLKEEISHIAKYLEISQKDFKKKCLKEMKKFNTKHHQLKTKKSGKPFGPCIFYHVKEGCLIHDVKPLHCKIGSCNQFGEDLNLWFTLNYFVNPYDPESIRQYATYLKVGGKTLPGASLQELVPNKETLKKVLDYDIVR